MEQAKNKTTSVALETIITNAVKIPGVKVNRSKFLAEVLQATISICRPSLIWGRSVPEFPKSVLRKPPRN